MMLAVQALRLELADGADGKPSRIALEVNTSCPNSLCLPFGPASGSQADPYLPPLTTSSRSSSAVLLAPDVLPLPTRPAPRRAPGRSDPRPQAPALYPRRPVCRARSFPRGGTVLPVFAPSLRKVQNRLSRVLQYTRRLPWFSNDDGGGRRRTGGRQS
jgi:hypothetical protein